MISPAHTIENGEAPQRDLDHRLTARRLTSPSIHSRNAWMEHVRIQDAAQARARARSGSISAAHRPRAAAMDSTEPAARPVDTLSGWEYR